MRDERAAGAEKEFPLFLTFLYIFKAVKLEMNSTKRTILFVILLTLKHYNTAVMMYVAS